MRPILKQNKKGLTNQIMIVLIMFVVLLFVIGLFYLASVTFPLITGSGKLIGDQIQNSITSTQPNSSLANATVAVIQPAEAILGLFESLVYFAFLGLFMGYIAIAYYVRTFPFLAVIWIFMIVVFVLFSMILSNAYQAAADAPPTSTFYQSWGNNDFMMRNLPYIVAAFGVFGGIFLFALLAKDSEAETVQL